MAAARAFAERLLLGRQAKARQHGGLGCHDLAAVLAIDAHQALGQHRAERRHHMVGVQAHVQKTADHVQRVVGMHRAEHQMPGQGRLYRDLRRLGVADLAHHHTVWVVPQDRAQASRKTQALALVDGDLRDPGQLHFHRVFDRDDLLAPGANLRQQRVQRGGLAAAGGPGDQQHAVGLARQHPQRTARCAVEAQAVQRDHLIGSGTAHAVEHPQHGVLAKCGGHDGQPQIHHPPQHLQAEAAVLRQPPLADVELGHHLQP